MGNKVLVEVMYFIMSWFEDSELVKWLQKEFSYKIRKQSILKSLKLDPQANQFSNRLILYYIENKVLAIINLLFSF